MSGESNERGDMTVLSAVAAGSARGRPTSIEERRRLVAESLQVGNPLNRAKDLPEHSDPKHECQIQLRVDDIRPYEHNPRRTNNAKFTEIKESIRSTGIRNPLTVTRRPGDQHFIIEAGGNTRLLAIQQLWAETHDPRFEKLTVLFRPWRSEGHVLVAHLIENEQRGEMTFWDKANGVVALKARFEEEKGRALSLRQLEDELKAVGFSVSTASLAHYLYATARLHVLGDAIPALSHVDVRGIQPRLNLVKRYAQMRGAIDEATLYAVVFEPVFRRHADRYRETGAFNASELCQACEEESARHFGEDLRRFRMILDSLAQSPQLAPLESPVTAAPEQNDARAVKPFNSAEQPADQREALQEAGQPPHPAPTELPALHRLHASIGRFAQVAVQHGLEERARSLIALISRQLNDSVSARFPELPDAKEGHSPAGIALDHQFLDWLLDGRDQAAAAFWEVAALVRDLRSEGP